MKAMIRFRSFAARLGALCLGFAMFAALGLAQDGTPTRRVLVGDVIVQGNRRKSTQELISLLKTRVGADYNPAVIEEDVRTLIATSQFANVQARFKDRPDGKVDVFFVVADYPNTIEEIVYQGAHSLRKSELETLTGLKKGDTLNPMKAQVACTDIVRRYNEKGRPWASCTLAEGTRAGDTRVVFAITEGPVVYVRDTQFVGNKFVSGPVLRQHIITSRRFLHANFLSKPFVAGMADQDVDRLREYYRSFGYEDVKVSLEVQWDHDNTTVVLIYHVDEGLRYHIKGAPQIDGNPTFAREELNRVVQVKADEFYSQSKIEGDVSRIGDYIGESGRQAKVTAREVYAGPGELTLHYDVLERPPANVGQIFIVGNTTTRQNVILRQLGIYPGQPLSYPELRQAEKNLAKINLFENDPEKGIHPSVTVIDPEVDSPFKDILVNVQETRTGSLLFGIGFNSDAGATGSIVLNERNFDITKIPLSFDDLVSGGAFRGAGQELRLEAIPGTELQRYTFQFREPYLFDTQYSLSVGGYYYTRFYDEDHENRLGTRITVGRRLNDYWTANLTTRVENVGIHNVLPGAPQDYQSVVGNNFLVSERIGLQYDTRDSYLRPTKGAIIDIGYEQVTGDHTFPLATIDYSQYWTVWERADGSGRHVVALRSSVGYAGPNTPVFERYYAGGFRSIRGFAFRGVGPDVDFFKVGGDFQLLNSLEYQVPVAAGDNVYVVGFVDSGTVESKVEIKDYRVAAGVGIRFTVPMLGPVPIALDFGFPIVKADRDKDQIFSFWLGFFR
jgi:outer membrane protein assembly complex protein YaeT